jgi:hypothetical protein
MSVEGAALSAVTGAATVNADNPWPGLLAFRETDQGYFRGRQTETADLLRLVMRERLTVLFGLSGLGKSSLLQAGLFPKLRPENVFPVYPRLDFSSGTDLVVQVFATITREASTREIEAPTPRNGETLWEYFHHEANNFWNSRNRPMMPLLVFDQFEEMFTLGRLNGDRTAATEAFLQQLADLAECRPPARLKAWIDEHPEEASAFDFERHHYKILLGIREDFLPDLESLRTRMPSVVLNRLRLRRMNGEAALLVVNHAQNLIDPNVGEQVVRFVGTDKQHLPLAELEIEPALLSVVCRELNNRRQKIGEAKISAGLLEGNQEQVLADFYERSTADLAPEVRTFLEDHLLTVSGYRDSVAMENALSILGVSRQAIDALVERRLVRREDRGGAQRLELTHDLLAGVVRASRDSRREREAAEKERAALLRAQEEERQALLRAKEEERLKLEKDQERERSERSKRELKLFRIAAVVFGALMLVAIGMASWAFRAQHQANEDRKTADAATQQAVGAEKQAREAMDRLLTQVGIDGLRSKLPRPPDAAANSGVGNGASHAPEPLANHVHGIKGSGMGEGGPAPPPPGPNAVAEAGPTPNTPSSAATVARVFIQIVNKTDSEYATQVGARLKAAGFSVQPTQYVPQAAILSRTDVRYYRKSDEAGAQKILGILTAAGRTSARMYIPSGQEDNPNVRPNTFEVWLANGSGGS